MLCLWRCRGGVALWVDAWQSKWGLCDLRGGVAQYMNCARCPEHIDRACLTRARLPQACLRAKRYCADGWPRQFPKRACLRLEVSAAQAFRKAWRGSSRAGALSGSARRAGALTSALCWRAFRSCGRSLFMRAGPRGGNRLGLCAQRAPICPLAARAGGPGPDVGLTLASGVAGNG